MRYSQPCQSKTKKQKKNSHPTTKRGEGGSPHHPTAAKKQKASQE
jgi:hypothetical protein